MRTVKVRPINSGQYKKLKLNNLQLTVKTISQREMIICRRHCPFN
jgi:hypothetical protein